VPTIGWDIGGVNTKLAHVHGGSVLSVLGRPYEIQRDPGALVPLLWPELKDQIPPVGSTLFVFALPEQSNAGGKQ